MKRLLLILLSMGLFYISQSQVKSPVITGNVTNRKVLADKSVTFNVGSAIPYIYNGGSIKLQVGFPYNVLYLDKTFPGELFVSKGYFPDQIQLRWEVSNNLALIDHFEIYRKKFNQKDSVWVDNVAASGRKWEDFYTEANEIYQYTVNAIGIPGEKIEGYTKISGVGFRSPLATVTGRVSFSGGTGVQNVVITASTDDVIPSRSINLSGTSYIEMPQYVEMDFSKGFTFQAYLKFSSTSDAGIFSKGSSLGLSYLNKKFVFTVGSQTVELPYSVSVGEFIHVSAEFDADSAKIIIPAKVKNINGQLIDTLFTKKDKISTPLISGNDSILLGKNGSVYFGGNLDEIRIWTRALIETEILRDFNRCLLGKEDGFYAYIRMNEGFGNRVYDCSKTGSNFNENHGDFKGENISWSTIVPTVEQLGNKGITDKEGNYIIAGIPFLTDGSAYKFTPMLAPHEFNPGFKILFLSEDAVVHNNIDFTDISAFNVNGSVVYRNTKKGVKGVQILVDGQPVYGKDTKPAQTNENGVFDISVPIGYHYISLKKDGHVFDAGGRWPYDENKPNEIVRYNFNQNLPLGEPFIDTTLITVIGRVIGGTGSNDIPVGFGKSVNNIGRATITLDHSSFNPELTFENTEEGLGMETLSYKIVTEIDRSGTRKYETIEQVTERKKEVTTLYTSAHTGEFVAKLIPEKFSVVQIGVNGIDKLILDRVIDLSTNPQLKYEYLYDKNNVKIDSFAYHVKLNYVYQTTPEIKVTNVNDNEIFSGEKDIQFQNPVNGITETIVVAEHFNYPIFEMTKYYFPKISVFESYKNFDNNEITYQAVKEAEVQIINDLALTENQKVYKLTPEMNGVVVDTFRAGIPNITKSVLDLTSFTKTMQVNVTVEGNTYSWKPNGELYRAYITGHKPKGNNFFTKGQQKPEIILRDPPGSNSYSWIEKGSVFSNSKSISTDLEDGSGMKLKIMLGAKFSAGIGVAVENETLNTGVTGISFSTSTNDVGKYTESVEFTQRIETSSDPGMVGSMADLYIGRSYNFFYGESDVLTLLPFDIAVNNNVTCLGSDELNNFQNNQSTYTLGLTKGYMANQADSDSTWFVYTQNHIVNKLLPELERQKQNLFVTSKRSDGRYKYVSMVPKNDFRYGVADSYVPDMENEDVVISAFSSYVQEGETIKVNTYKFYPEEITLEDLNGDDDKLIREKDEIRQFNDQISVWMDAIRGNETEKALSIIENKPVRNISFDGGVGKIVQSVKQSFTYETEKKRSKKVSFDAEGSVGFKVGGVGLQASGNLMVEHVMGIGTSSQEENSMEFGYEISDGNAGDYYSINVYTRNKDGLYNIEELRPFKKDLPGDFEWSILGGAVGGGLLAATLGTFSTASGLSAGGGAVIVGMAAGMAVGAGLGYIPYTSFHNEADNWNEKISAFDVSSPIFSTLGGVTSCPYQDNEFTFFYKEADGDSVVINKKTLQRDKPEISAEPYEVFNVPSTEPALYTLKISNNSESGDGRWYIIEMIEQSNPYGAEIKIDADFDSKTIFVPGNSTVTKTLTVRPSDTSVLNYDSIAIVMHSICQYDPTDYIKDIADTVYISAHFQPSCTNAEILEPLDNWVVNVRDNDTVTVRIGNYNLNHDSFQSFRFEYKSATGNIWIPVKYFVNDPLLANKDEIPDTLLINDQPFVTFDWSMINLADRSYDIRVVSHCTDFSENESEILTGILDGQRPQVFGTPQPADGILNVDENISVQFNEPIEAGLLNQFNFDVKGTLNYYKLKHDAYIRTNGTTDYGVIPEGISFNNKSFTIEFWIRPDDYGNAVLFSQGNDPATNIEISLKDNFRTVFKLGNLEFDAALQFTATVPAEAWQHLAYVFDIETGDVFIYQNDKIILEVRGSGVNLTNSGRIYVGKSAVPGRNQFNGSLHELRIWSKVLSLGEVYTNQYKALSGDEVGLYGYWPLNEAFGKLAADKAASRHMEVFAPWETYPGGSAWNFANNNCVEFFTGYFAIIPEMDYSVEFWLKDNNPADTVCLFSNQKGDGTEGENLLEKALSIYATPDGKIWVASQGNVFEAVANDYFDNSWHHFALVVRRRGNVSSFIDGQLQNEKPNTLVGGIAGTKMVLGARKWKNLKGTGSDRFYSGKLDEFRIWDLARTITQIRLDMNSKLAGNEPGLMVYLPFEGYYEDNLGVIQQQPTLENFVTDVNGTDATFCVGEAFTTDAPNMKDVRPVQSIAYDFISSDDAIIINPKQYLLPQIEKNIIEITVQGVEDKYGNRMASPATWTAYVHRNQIRWEDEKRIFTKEIYKTMQFVASIKNTGGQQISFSIENLPVWLTANPASGSVNPESVLEITFTINPALNIGDYNEDIILHTENGFDEKLPVTVRVFKKPPGWNVDASAFEATMNMIGTIKIEGVLSTDVFDYVAAFKRGTDSIRGVTNVRYIPDFDSYLVFLNVYGNGIGEELEFRLWDASAGQILDNVIPSNTVFKPNAVIGNTYNPVVFEAKNLFRQYIPLAKGWNWVSFNKLAANQNNLNSFFGSLEPGQNDQIKSHGIGFNNFDKQIGWSIGGIDSIDNRRMYQVKISKPDTVVYSGEMILPEENPINLNAGWNHISYLPDLAMDVNDALRLYVGSDAEIIKSQFAFSMYDKRVGWLGTLESMQPGMGYMLKVNKAAVLKYPNNTIYKGAKVPLSTSPPLGWGNNLSEFEGNISIIARIDVSDKPDITLNSSMILGSFISNECHGFSSPLNNSGLEYLPFFVNVSNSVNGQMVSFRLYDGATGNTWAVDEKVQFISDAVFGTIQEPLVLTLKSLTTGNGTFESKSFVRCYPNPFNRQVNIEYSGTGESATIEVLNTEGTLVKLIFEGYPAEGKNTAVWEGNNQSGVDVAPGMYYIRFISGDSAQTVKISKTK